ncbi:DUF7678 domain-containing protein [Streptococcus suis]
MNINGTVTYEGRLISYQAVVLLHEADHCIDNGRISSLMIDYEGQTLTEYKGEWVYYPEYPWQKKVLELTLMTIESELIVREFLRWENLEVRDHDGQNAHMVDVWEMRTLLAKAYKAGQASVK